MGASNEKGDAKGSVEEGGKVVRARWSGVTKWEGVGWITGRNESISKCAWQIAGLALWLLHIPLRKQGKKMKKIKLAITSFCDKTLFKPTISASTGSGGPCNEHRQKAKSCGLNYEIWMFHCFTLTICRINTSSALCFSATQWQKLWQWWGSKMSLNHVEPCWTLPLRNTTFDCLERPCSNTAPASATSDPGDASNSATCRKKESAWRIRRYCIQSLNVSIYAMPNLAFRDDHALHQRLPPFSGSWKICFDDETPAIWYWY